MQIIPLSTKRCFLLFTSPLYEIENRSYHTTGQVYLYFYPVIA